MATGTVTGPTRQPREFGLRSFVEFEEDARLGAHQVVNYEALPCGIPQSTVALCWEDLETQVAKEGDDAGWGSSIFDPFAAYAGASCWIGPDQRYAEQARAVLEAGIDDLMGPRLAAWVLAEGTDLTDQAKPNLALAEVEHALREGYRGRGTLLMSAYTAMILNPGLASAQDGVLGTGTGSRVAILPGLPKMAIIGTGAIKVVHSPIREFEAPDRGANIDLAIAEQIYTALVDCDFAVYANITAP